MQDGRQNLKDYLNDLDDMDDYRNVHLQTVSRRKPLGMATKSYSHKAVEKINYAKEEREKKSQEAKEVTKIKEEKQLEEAKWVLDRRSVQRDRRHEARDNKAQSKSKRKQELAQIYADEERANRIAHNKNPGKPKHP